MNQREFEALSDNELPALAVSLYVRCFRQHMDFTSACVFVSFRGMSQAMEHTPPRGSTKPITRPSKEELRQAIRQLERAGLISLVEKGSISHNRAAQYRCSLASVFLRANEEPHESHTGTPRRSNTIQPHVNQGVSGNVVNLRKNDEPHIPEQPREDEVYAREEILFSGDWLGLASNAGLVDTKEQIEAWFHVWRLGDNGNTYRSLTTHKRAWSKYCATIKAKNVQKGGSNEVNQHNGTTGGQYRNATAETLRRCRERAQAGIGVGDFDFSDEA